LSDDFIVSVHFEVGQELRLRLLNQLLLMLLELELFVSRQGFPSRLYNVAGGDFRTIRSLEPAIDGRFDGSRCVFPSGVAKKYVDTFLGLQSLNTNQRQCSLHKGPNGPRPGARLGFLPNGRTVHAYAGVAEDRRRRLDLAPERDPVGEERSEVMSRLGRPTYTPLIDVESKRSEEFGDWKAKLELD
jgi:hypothetical protein